MLDQLHLSLMDALENCVDEILHKFGGAKVLGLEQWFIGAFKIVVAVH